MCQRLMADKRHNILTKRKTKNKNQDKSQEVLTFLGSRFLALQRPKGIIMSITVEKYYVKS